MELGRPGHQEIEPSDQGNGKLLCHEFLNESLDVPEIGLVDPDAAPLHEGEAKELQRQRETTSNVFSPQAEAIDLGRVL